MCADLRLFGDLAFTEFFGEKAFDFDTARFNGRRSAMGLAARAASQERRH
jgi:hypothetical protein